MNDMVLGDIAIEFELLIKEIDFVLSKIEMDNEEIIVFLKRLQTVLFHNRNIKLDYGEEKALSRFLWDILG